MFVPCYWYCCWLFWEIKLFSHTISKFRKSFVKMIQWKLNPSRFRFAFGVNATEKSTRLNINIKCFSNLYTITTWTIIQLLWYVYEMLFGRFLLLFISLSRAQFIFLSLVSLSDDLLSLRLMLSVANILWLLKAHIRRFPTNTS